MAAAPPSTGAMLPSFSRQALSASYRLSALATTTTCCITCLADRITWPVIILHLTLSPPPHHELCRPEIGFANDTNKSFSTIDSSRAKPTLASLAAPFTRVCVFVVIQTVERCTGTKCAGRAAPKTAKQNRSNSHLAINARRPLLYWRIELGSTPPRRRWRPLALHQLPPSRAANAPTDRRDPGWLLYPSCLLFLFLYLSRLISVPHAIPLPTSICL